MKIFLVLFAALAVLYIAAGQNNGEFFCELGVTYIENFCNECICDHGNLRCTDMVCSWSDEYRNCTVEMETISECHTCHCVVGWGLLCTNRDCNTTATPIHYATEPEGVPMNPTKGCEENKSVVIEESKAF
ncbi:uncharacterized protein LOC116172207 [Photinus pyralis]|uniref:uncharacterized protein LOC116172207 n=1 Tax=Photinus pyralis TaxID=7054 RepID=UPI00126755BD|nr:uncharacterized protein LOC116172207 [Photinus pyralis]